MTNLIGQYEDIIRETSKDQDYILYLYGKNETKPGRKMGHLNKQIS